MKVAELIATLQKLPPDARVLTDGYEGGFAPIALGDPVRLQELHGLPDWVGRYLTVEAAAAELAGTGESGWPAMRDTPAPTVAGPPFTAVVLGRVGW